MSASGAMMVTIADPGWNNPVSVPVSGPSASWGVNAIGLFSCQVPARRAHGLGWPNLKGRWLRFEDATMGPWGGVIKRNPTETLAGTMELSADSFHARMKGIRTPITLKLASGTPGSLAMRLVTDCATDKRLWFDSITGSSSGSVIRLELRGDDLYEVIESLASDYDHEFDVTLNDDGTLDWAFKRRVGQDKTNEVILADGWNVIGGQVAPTIDEVRNDILAVSDEDDWIEAEKRVVVDPDSILAFERQAVTRRYTGLGGVASLITRAKADLATDAIEAIPATLTVRAQDPVLRSIRQGDTVRYWSARQNQRYLFRCLSRSIDHTEGLAQLSGDCVAEEDVT